MIDLITYYAKFVPKTVIEAMFVSGKDEFGYNDLKTSLMALPNTHVIPEIKRFIFSPNSKYVLDAIRSTPDFILFIEYDKISFAPIQDRATQQRFGLSIIHEWDMNSDDNPNELLIMDQCKAMLERILWQMFNDTKAGCINLIDFPCDIIPIESELLANRIGWTALFGNSNTSL